MDLLARSNNTIILPQRPPKTKVERFTPRICNNTPTFLHEQRPGRVILKNLQFVEHQVKHSTHPDLLLVASASRHPEVGTAIASSKTAILGLTVHSRRRPRDVQ